MQQITPSFLYLVLPLPRSKKIYQYRARDGGIAPIGLLADGRIMMADFSSIMTIKLEYAHVILLPFPGNDVPRAMVVGEHSG